MGYFLRIVEKNDAGWFFVSTVKDNLEHSYLNFLTDNPGYAAVSEVDNWEIELILPNAGDNFMTCSTTLFRDVTDPSRGPWHIKFKMVEVTDDKIENDVTPIYDATCLDYEGDNGKIIFILNPTLDAARLLENNNRIYQEFLSIRKKKP